MDLKSILGFMLFANRSSIVAIALVGEAAQTTLWLNFGKHLSIVMSFRLSV